MIAKILKPAVAGALSVLFASSAYAAVCAVGTEDDFTYRNTFASQCVAEGGNDAETMVIFGQTYSQLVKFDGDQDTPEGTTFDGDPITVGVAPDDGTLTFSLKFLGLGDDGFYSYELLVEDNPESLIPATMDLVGLVKQASGYQAYRFDEAYIGDNGNLGTFKSLFGPNANNEFSHFSILGRNYSEFIRPEEVPEPATIGLIGLAMVGLAAARRRRKA